MKWALIIFVYINGGWVTADELIEGWRPSVYETEQDCLHIKEVATLIEIQNLNRKKYYIIKNDVISYHIPRRFECAPEGEFTGK